MANRPSTPSLEALLIGAIFLASLLPIMWSGSGGSEVMRRIAAPMSGGMIAAPLLSMFVVPAAYLLVWRSKQWCARAGAPRRVSLS